ncbi:Spo0E family sporulation regulatory protein-aspartic acid phosphatase [Bacillus coahuilensis]|uniref:Spo0E family sporulation regulatory protein-aspartic acid phosphatase n=1 Tax=Bacillus coahuilensis TaxID=408580 RepID=UPI003B8A5C54
MDELLKPTLLKIDKLIENKRKEMILVGLRKGLTHKDTLRLSRELDDLLNIYQKRYSLHKGNQTKNIIVS